MERRRSWWITVLACGALLLGMLLTVVLLGLPFGAGDLLGRARHGGTRSAAMG